MAVFYHPTRGAPTTTVTIAGLESYPSSRPLEKIQVRAETPGGKAIVYNLANSVQWLTLIIKNLKTADRTSLLDFIQTTVDFSSNTFDLTDDAGTQYDSCLFWIDNADFVNVINDLFEEELLIRVSP